MGTSGVQEQCMVNGPPGPLSSTTLIFTEPPITAIVMSVAGVVVIISIQVREVFIYQLTALRRSSLSAIEAMLGFT